jgi:tetratricopeptide (TPR) repeat protein
MQPFARLLRLATILGLATLAGCSGDEPAAEVSFEDALARERAAAFYIESEYGRALAELKPLAERDPAAVDDLVQAAIAALEPENAQLELARGWLARARALAPKDPRVLWNDQRLAAAEGGFERAVALLQEVLAAHPEDVPTKLALGSNLENLDRFEEAEKLYRQVFELGPDAGVSWYMSAVYRLQRLMILAGRDDEADVFIAEHRRLVERGLKVPEPSEIERGAFGAIPAPRPEALYPRPEPEVAAALAGGGWTLAEPLRQPLPGVQGLLLLPADLVEGAQLTKQGGNLGNVHHLEPSADALVAFGDAGLLRLTWNGAAFESALVAPGPVAAVAVLDLREEGAIDADLAVAFGAELALFEGVGATLVRRESGGHALPGAPSALVALDYDHEGDADLVAVGAFGARLLRNDGADSALGSFADAGAEAGLPADRAFQWCRTEDFDRDNDVDLLLGGPSGLFLADNLRGGRFGDASSRLPAGLTGAIDAADFNGDGWTDLRDAAGSLWIGGPSGAWRAAPGPAAPPGPALLLSELAGAPQGALAGDKEGDGAPDLFVLEGETLVTRAVGSAVGASALRLALVGEKDSRRGLGALVEVLLGPAYRRVYTRGETLFLATHGREQAEVVRVTWPNGVIQHAVGLPGDGGFAIHQREGLVGSCPFLYTWNGERYVFISDVLGITPLGLPMAPGMLVPPDHDEYVLIRGADLQPKDGEYLLQITEELREVTYLDRVRLDVVDHPAGVEVFPNERFTFPPFPEPHVHSVRDALAPTRATDGHGLDWTAELAQDDQRFALAFESLGGQHLGLADPWFLELAFDPERVRSAERLRLVANGWFYWTDASVNIAAAGHPQAEFVPPLLQVPDGTGGWRDAGVLGFPAGKLKTIVVDVGAILDPADPRLRVATSLQLYWDSLRLAVDADDAPLAVRSIEPAGAELWRRGFSRPLEIPRRPELWFFEWDELDEPRFNQHPGMYTRYGACSELLGAVDDRFAILGAGDALALRFEARGLPPLAPGFERDYLLYLDGWAKDRDPNTVGALYVEPLPFHGMSGYPYGPEESFPDDAEHRAWRSEWNTRPGHLWIEPLR